MACAANTNLTNFYTQQENQRYGEHILHTENNPLDGKVVSLTGHSQ